MTASPIQLNTTIIENLLKREMVRQFVAAIGEQATPFTHNEELVIIGSGIPLMEGFGDPAHSPRRRIVTDLDFYLHEPEGERLEIVPKQLLARKMQDVLTAAASGFGAKFLPYQSGNGTLRRDYMVDEIDALLQRDDVRILLDRIMGAKQGNYAHDLKQPFGATLDIHSHISQTSMMPPVPLEGTAPPTNKSGMPVLIDHISNTLAVKMARLIVGPGWTEKYQKKHFTKVTDIIDIVDIMELEKAKGVPLPDPKLLRVLTLAHIAQLTRGHLEETSVLRLKPDHIVQTEDMDSHLTNHQKTHELLGRDFQLSEPVCRSLLEQVYALVSEVFPHTTEGLPLSQAERDFVTNISNELQAKASQYSPTGQNTPSPPSLEVLKKEHAGVFNTHPKLAHDITHFVFLRPKEAGRSTA